MMLSFDLFFKLLECLLKILCIIVPILISVAFYTLAERKILSAIQRRKGPNVVGFFGLLQPFADALKLILKETVFPLVSNKFLFFCSPVVSFVLSLIIWGVFPFSYGIVFSDINLGLLYIFGVSTLSVYAIVLAGWSSNSRYAFLGGLRSSAQMISYEVSLGLILISVLVCVGSLNLTEVVEFQRFVWFIIPFYPLSFMFLASALAETARSPFDLPEAEGELVAGYFVEYGSVNFALFFIAEYANIIFMSSMFVILFLGGWFSPFGHTSYVWFLFKLNIVLFCFVWIRAIFPRYRYDQLMQLGWKVFLPSSLGFLVFISSILFIF